MKLNWQQIETVFLDMDGTLLDLHFDNYFWMQHVPTRYAQKHGLDVEEAKVVLYQRYKAVEGSMQWYCVDYWSEQLGLDIPLLKHEVNHLIRVHPHVPDFLAKLRQLGKQVWLVTNAHSKSLSLKMEKTQLAHHFDELVCAHEFEKPKENPEFWGALRNKFPFRPAATLLIDDSLSVLRSAHRYGILNLLCVLQPDSKAPQREINEFRSIHMFTEIMPS